MPAGFIVSLYIFVLAAFVGFQVIVKVSRLLHTPLMSLTNALEAIVIVAAMIIAGRREGNVAVILGTIAVVASFTNVVAGFMITERMLSMFKSGGAKKS